MFHYIRRNCCFGFYNSYNNGGTVGEICGNFFFSTEAINFIVKFKKGFFPYYNIHLNIIVCLNNFLNKLETHKPYNSVYKKTNILTSFSSFSFCSTSHITTALPDFSDSSSKITEISKLNFSQLISFIQHCCKYDEKSFAVWSKVVLQLKCFLNDLIVTETVFKNEIQHLVQSFSDGELLSFLNSLANCTEICLLDDIFLESLSVAVCRRRFDANPSLISSFSIALSSLPKNKHSTNMMFHLGMWFRKLISKLIISEEFMKTFSALYYRLDPKTIHAFLFAVKEKAKEMKPKDFCQIPEALVYFNIMDECIFKHICKLAVTQPSHRFNEDSNLMYRFLRGLDSYKLTIYDEAICLVRFSKFVEENLSNYKIQDYILVLKAFSSLNYLPAQHIEVIERVLRKVKGYILTNFKTIQLSAEDCIDLYRTMVKLIHMDGINITEKDKLHKPSLMEYSIDFEDRNFCPVGFLASHINKQLIMFQSSKNFQDIFYQSPWHEIDLLAAILTVSGICCHSVDCGGALIKTVVNYLKDIFYSLQIYNESHKKFIHSTDKLSKILHSCQHIPNPYLYNLATALRPYIPSPPQIDEHFLDIITSSASQSGKIQLKFEDLHVEHNYDNLPCSLALQWLDILRLCAQEDIMMLVFDYNLKKDHISDKFLKDILLYAYYILVCSINNHSMCTTSMLCTTYLALSTYVHLTKHFSRSYSVSFSSFVDLALCLITKPERICDITTENIELLFRAPNGVERLQLYFDHAIFRSFSNKLNEEKSRCATNQRNKISHSKTLSLRCLLKYFAEKCFVTKSSSLLKLQEIESIVNLNLSKISDEILVQSKLEPVENGADIEEINQTDWICWNDILGENSEIYSYKQLLQVLKEIIEDLSNVVLRVKKANIFFLNNVVESYEENEGLMNALHILKSVCERSRKILYITIVQAPSSMNRRFARGTVDYLCHRTNKVTEEQKCFSKMTELYNWD